MVTLTISMPEHHKAWIDNQIEQGSIVSTSDYVSELIQRDRQRRDVVEYSLEDLQRLVAEADASGISDETVPSILARAKAAARIRGNVA
jgi:antitoxin ParD1/3/4